MFASALSSRSIVLAIPLRPLFQVREEPLDIFQSSFFPILACV